MAAINEEFAPNEEVIQEGDVIAFIPPVSGG
jgi:molybdopterin synthase sulfur carrier subunit